MELSPAGATYSRSDGFDTPKRREVLAEVAAIHRRAPNGEKVRQVAEFLGVAHRSAGTYISRARKAGLLETGEKVA